MINLVNYIETKLKTKVAHALLLAFGTSLGESIVSYSDAGNLMGIITNLNHILFIALSATISYVMKNLIFGSGLKDNGKATNKS